MASISSRADMQAILDRMKDLCKECAERTKLAVKHPAQKFPKLETIFKRENHFCENTLPNLIQNNPEKIRLTLMEQNRDIADAYGDSRIPYLKSQFKSIMSYSLAFLHNFEDMDLPEWLKYKEEMKKPNPDLSDIKMPEGFINQHMSDEFIEYVKNYGKKVVHILQDVRRCVHEPVRSILSTNSYQMSF
ncbi:unnamed protein product [Moneuplotes crassus]|uniref:Uncharacterized protein n=1 Tax=Euplotes crassus TaxID=5936 RepID=A0AAD1UF51_EUPCR|nr:unnamed protein product [Moneuplotes crassus]